MLGYNQIGAMLWNSLTVPECIEIKRIGTKNPFSSSLSERAQMLHNVGQVLRSTSEHHIWRVRNPPYGVAPTAC